MKKGKNIIKTALVLFLFIIGLNNIKASPEEYRNRLYKAFISGDMATWERILSQMEAQYLRGKSKLLLSEISFTQYGLIAYYLGNEKVEKAEKVLGKAMSNVDFLLAKNPLRADMYALKGALYGFQIALSKFKALSLGRKSISYIRKSLDMNASCIRCHVERANQLYYTPAIVGGDKQKAIFHYEKAVDLFKNDMASNKKNWFYLTTMTVLAQAYEEAGSYKKAIQMYKEILSYEPQYSWVKDELYPALVQKIRSRV
jgi:tetratricopeptide (TPR) repeat protein